MRFSTKVDLWIGMALAIAAAFSLAAPIGLIASAVMQDQPIPWHLAVPILVWMVVLAATLPQYYELHADGLFIRQGWRKTRISYDDLTSAEDVDSAWSAAVYSTRRVHIQTKDAGQFLIAPKIAPVSCASFRRERRS